MIPLMQDLIRETATKSSELLCRFHRELTEKLGPINGELSPYDVFFAGALRRSYALTRGFFTLILSLNFSAAAPLIRLQLDNVLRTAASAWVKDPMDFFDGLIAGKSINKFISSDGKPMTDKYLCNRMATYEPWISSLYEETSAFIHLSDKHLHAALAPGMEPKEFKCILQDEESDVPDWAYSDAIISFVKVTNLFLEVVTHYTEQKIADRIAQDISAD
jgi:hypothetical protein